MVKEFNPNSYITQALTTKKRVIKNIIPNKDAIKLAPRSNNQGLTVNVFDSAAYGDVRSQFQSDGQKGQIFNGHGVHFNLTYLTN